MSEQDTSSDQHPEIPETKKEPDKTFWKAFGLRFTISVVAVLIAACIAPSIHFDNEDVARFGLAAATLTLFIFIDLLIYLFAYKEELSGFIFKIINTIKIFILKVWQKINSIKKFLKVFGIFIGVLLFIATEIFLIHKTYEGFSNHAAEIRNLPDGFNFSLKSDELSKIQDIRFDTFLHAIGVLLLPALPALFFTKEIKSTLEKHILRTFVLTVIIGGLLAFLIPTFLYNYGFIGETKDLTTALLGLTGGVVALFSLIKSHQKSELEREQLEVQKQKDARDHIRQLHSSYNDRFDKAVAELNGSDVKASYAAVPKLAKLADAWLDYEDLSNDTKELEKLKDKAEKEAQIIINILCKYIRTIPNNYTHEQLKEFKSLPEADIEILTHEADIRRLIFSEISKRSSTFTKNGKGEIIETIPGIWSDFDFDFTGAPIFYPLSSLTIEKGNFSSAKFYSNADFSGATFTQKADFSEATFTQTAHFFKAIFTHDADFRGADFSGADFSKATFIQNANFNEATFTYEVYFMETTFTHDAYFWRAIFTHEVRFLVTTFAQKVNFSHAFFEKYAPTFASGELRARFSVSTAQEDYIFSVRQDSKPINCGTATLDSKSLEIPLGAVLFNPSSGETSGPAKPREDSDTEGEKPTE